MFFISIFLSFSQSLSIFFAVSLTAKDPCFLLALKRAHWYEQSEVHHQNSTSRLALHRHSNRRHQRSIRASAVVMSMWHQSTRHNHFMFSGTGGIVRRMAKLCLIRMMDIFRKTVSRWISPNMYSWISLYLGMLPSASGYEE